MHLPLVAVWPIVPARTKEHICDGDGVTEVVGVTDGVTEVVGDTDGDGVTLGLTVGVTEGDGVAVPVAVGATITIGAVIGAGAGAGTGGAGGTMGGSGGGGGSGMRRGPRHRKPRAPSDLSHLRTAQFAPSLQGDMTAQSMRALMRRR